MRFYTVKLTHRTRDNWNVVFTLPALNTRTAIKCAKQELGDRDSWVATSCRLTKFTVESAA